MRLATDERGFTLLEMLVAFAIASLGLMTVYSALGFHWRDVAQSSLHDTTLAHIQSQLDAIGVSVTPTPGRTTWGSALSARSA